LFYETLKIINLASYAGFKRVKHFNPANEFARQIRTNNQIWSAFKVHRLQNDIASKLLDEKGKLKTFGKFAKDVKPITTHQCKQWLKTEYNTAVLRASKAAEFRQFQAESDVLPCVEWLPTTSANPGEDHIPFWGTIKPVNDNFWNEHRPGDRWNCKCGWQATDKAPTKDDFVARNPKSDAQPGLENNPAADGELFSDKHPYFADSCAACPINGKKPQNLFVFRQKKNCYNCPNAKELVETAGKPEKSATATEREKYTTQMLPLLEKKVVKQVADKDISVGFTKYGNRHLYSDTFGRAKGLKKEDLKTIDKSLEKATFIKSAKLSKVRKDNIVKFYYFKDKKKELYYNVAKRVYLHNRIEHIERFLYSVTNGIK
jgi:hypothetical protein